MIGLLVALSASVVTAPGATSANVTFVTRDRLYLDRGSADGVRVGTPVEIVRRKKAVPLCAVDGVAAHYATCALRSQGARVKDRVLLRGAARPAPTASGTATATVGPGLEAAAAVSVGAQPYALVDRDRPWARAAGGRSAIAGARLAYGFSSFRLDDAPYNAAELEAWFDHLSLGFADLEAALRVRARARPTRVEGTRFRPGAAAELYVLEATLGSRPVGGAYAFTLGRVGSHRVLGLRIFDGGVVGLRLADDAVELGAFMGLLPDAVDLLPSTQRYAGGAYLRARHLMGGGALSYEARAGVVGAPDQPIFLDAEVAAAFDAGRALVVHAGGRGGYQTGAGGGARWISARAEVSSQPIDALELRASYRERRDTALPDAELDAVVGAPVGTWQRADARHVLGDVRWALSDALAVVARGGYSSVVDDTSLERVFVGPELELPRLFGATGGLLIGYQESLGWVAGRSLYVQSSLHVLERWDVLARAGVSLDRDGLRDEWRSEMDVYLHLSAALAPWLSLTAGAGLHGTVFDAAGEALSPGLAASAALTGSL